MYAHRLLPYQAAVSTEVRRQIERSETVCRFIIDTIPNKIVIHSDEIELVSGLFSLTIDYQFAILHLLRSGQFSGSAFALIRPLVDAAYRAHWIYACAKPELLPESTQEKMCFQVL